MFISIVLVIALGAAIAIQAKINTTLSNRLNVTAIKGAKGDKGEPGTPGTNGIHGLKGDKGETGIAGTNGITGTNGEPGPKGDKGEPGTCTCTHDPEAEKVKLRVLVEYIVQAFPPAGDDPRIQDILNG
jgi:hypothetical protein